MASSLPISAQFAATVTSFLIFSSLFLLSARAQDGFDFGPEKKTHLHFFFHDVLSGPNPTAIRVARAPATAASFNGFGDITMIDDALTEGPDPSSKLIGRAQGFYAMAAQQETGLLMTMNYHFVTGDYNGSTLAVLARNNVFLDTRELSVVGGTGYFRLARGYALAKTRTLTMGGDAVVEYNVYVTHY